LPRRFCFSPMDFALKAAAVVFGHYGKKQTFFSS